MRPLRIALFCILVLFTAAAVYRGVTTVPTEVDSTSYHIPLARAVLQGTVFQPRSFTFPNPTYPGSTELILTLFMALRIPLNLFNVTAWICMCLAAYVCGKRLGLSRTPALLCASSLVLLPTVVRLLPTQTADLWLDAGFLALILLLLKPSRSPWYFAGLGIAAGLVAGAKFSGPLFVLMTFAIWGKPLMKHTSFRASAAFFIPFLLLGGSWYIRNLVWYGNPVYPSPVPFFPGAEGFSLYMRPHWHTVVSHDHGFVQTVNAWLSEYLVFVAAPLVCAVIWVRTKDVILRRLVLLGFAGLFVYLIVPGYPFNYDNIVSEVRYSHPAMIAWILAIFAWTRNDRLFLAAAPALVVNILAFLLPFPYRPKLCIIVTALTLLLGLAVSRLLKRMSV